MISNIWLSIIIYYLTTTETVLSFSIQRRPGTRSTRWTSSSPKLSRIKHSVLHVTVTDNSNNQTSTPHKVFGILTTSRTKAATSPSRNRRTSLFFSKSSVEIKNETEHNIHHTQTKNNSKYAITKDRNDQTHNDVIPNNIDSSLNQKMSSNNDQADDNDITNNVNDFDESFTSHHDRDDRSINKKSSINNETHSSTSNINNGDNKKKQDKAYDPLLSWTDWSTSTSLGSFLLKRKKIEEEEIKKIQDLIGDNDNDNGMIFTTKEQKKLLDNKNSIPTVPIDIDQTLKSLASEAEGTFVSFIDLTTGKKDKENVKKKKKAKDDASKGLDKELIREVEESITMLSAQQNLMKDIDVLPFPLQQQQQQRSTSSSLVSSEAALTMLPLSDEAHTARIEKDIKHLSVSIASTIDDAEQWKRFTEDGGGLLPLLECIRDGATEIDRGVWENNDFYEEGMIGLVEKRDEAFAAACKACKTLRDLCATSKPFAAIITDSILRADAVWSTPEKKENGDIALQDGLISNLITLLRFSLQADNLYNRRSRRQKIRALRNRGVQRMGSRKQKRGEYHLPSTLFN